MPSLLSREAKKEEVEKEARFFYQEVLTKKIRPKIKKKLKQYQKKGHETLLVTNCVDLVAQEVGKNLGFDKVVSTRLENKGLKLTGKIEGEIVYGKNKTRALLKVISREKMKNAIAFGDHISDRFLFKSVRKAYLVNPSEKTLRFYQNKYKKNNLKIIY